MHKANCFAHCKRETERTTKRPFYVTGDRGQRNLLKTRGPNMICQSLSVAVSDLGLYLHGTNEEPTAQTPRASEYPNLASFSKLDCSRRQAWSTKHRWKVGVVSSALGCSVVQKNGHWKILLCPGSSLSTNLSSPFLVSGQHSSCYHTSWIIKQAEARHPSLTSAVVTLIWWQ